MSSAAEGAKASVVALPDEALLRVHAELEARRPGAPKPAAGVRPRRRPWTYIEIWRLEAATEEIKRRGL
ncbi:MAG: hypothetical protein ACHQ0J_09070 [Candidatus Dormibacterales bacterium]